MITILKIILSFISIALLIILIFLVLNKITFPIKVGTFHKVKGGRWYVDYRLYMNSIGEDRLTNTNDIYKGINLPARATKGSAGYDFYSPIAFVLHPGETIQFPTGICADINKGWVLKIYPRSSLGCKYQTVLTNTVGIIDSDYYYSDNGGHIWVKLVNNGDKDLIVKRGDRVVQGIFEPYGITYDDKAGAQRTGGFGSSGR